MNYLISQFLINHHSAFCRGVYLVLYSRFDSETMLSFSVSGRGVDGDRGVRRAAQTAPARYGISSLDDTRGEIDRL